MLSTYLSRNLYSVHLLLIYLFHMEYRVRHSDYITGWKVRRSCIGTGKSVFPSPKYCKSAPLPLVTRWPAKSPSRSSKLSGEKEMEDVRKTRGFFLLLFISSMLHYHTSVILHAWFSYLHLVWCLLKQFSYYMCVLAVHLHSLLVGS
jgi:hypothetical protein